MHIRIPRLGLRSTATQPGSALLGRHRRRLLSTSNVLFDSVLKIYSVNSSPNYILPWQKKPQREATGSGFVLDGRRILTNAHVVADQHWIQIRKHGAAVKYSARARFVNHDCDLALLEVDDDEFWDDLPSLQLGGVPKMQDRIVVAGYPSCGDNLCVTSGVVSRVEPQQYCHGASSLLAVQIDAAINPGNSGGPALMDGKVAGVAFQTHLGSENCGFIIPVPVIDHFLQQSQRAPRSGAFCSLGIACQPTENRALREFLKLPTPGVGVLVNKVRPLSPAAGFIQENDVLISFDGHAIASDGTIAWRGRERIAFDFLVSMKFQHDLCDVVVLRDGVAVPLQLPLWAEDHLVPVHQYDQAPAYFVAAGLVFCPLAQPYLHEFGDDWFHRSPRRLCDLAMNGVMKEGGEQVVILSQVLAHPVNLGYADLANLQVVAVDGVRVRNLRHLVERYDEARRTRRRFVRVELEDNRTLALDVEAAERAAPEILGQYRIPADRSADLLVEAESRPAVEELTRTATARGESSVVAEDDQERHSISVVA